MKLQVVFEKAGGGPKMDLTSLVGLLAAKLHDKYPKMRTPSIAALVINSKGDIGLATKDKKKIIVSLDELFDSSEFEGNDSVPNGWETVEFMD